MLLLLLLTHMQVKAVLDLYKIPYTTLDVNPLTKVRYSRPSLPRPFPPPPLYTPPAPHHSHPPTQ